MNILTLILIMILGAALGGTVYYLSPGNHTEESKPKMNWWKSFWLGLGATTIIPILFITTESRLLDGITICSSSPCEPVNSVLKVIADTANSALESLVGNTKPAETSSRTTAITTGAPKPAGNTAKKSKAGTTQSGSAKTPETTLPFSPAKGYLLWFAYCVLAASTGYRFIDKIIKKTGFTEDDVKELKEKNKSLEKTLESNQKNAQLGQEQEVQQLQKNMLQNVSLENARLVREFKLPILPVITHPDDPQKGRFGGQPEKNGKKLQAAVSDSYMPGFYWVELSVTSTDAEPLESDVIFYLHDSFSKTIRTVQSHDGKAILDRFLSYGAFTVGVVTDYGDTLLELDMADPIYNFPKEFRDR
jgi:hypothetical protein